MLPGRRHTSFACGRHARRGRRHPAGHQGNGPALRHLPLQRLRRPEREHHQLGRARDPHPHGHLAQRLHVREVPAPTSVSQCILKARLYNLELQKREAERAAQYAGKDAIAFGSQIRTYTLQPYRLVKDHRTNSECGDVEAVLDGQIDQFQQRLPAYRHEQQR